MAIVGYARVSSAGQSLDVQLDKLKAAGCERVFQEKVSGTSTDGREQLAELMRYVREGDEVVITKLDRLGRSLVDLLDITNQFTANGVTFRVLDQNLETSTPQGRLMFSMLGAFAEFETALRKDRQMDGIAKAKAKGTHMGRPALQNLEEVKQALRDGTAPTEVAKRLSVGRSTVQRIAKQMRDAGELE